MRKYTVTIDDQDREQVPSSPWTASGSLDETLVSSGVGATPRDALDDLLDNTEFGELLGKP